MALNDTLNTAAKVDFLSCPSAYPERPDRVEVRETHLSWLFLTSERVYKLKKPLQYDFLDFSTLGLRQRYCHEEVRLNRRLSPDVYCGVVPLMLGQDERLQVAGPGKAVDWLVQMRRLANERVLEHRILNGPAVELAEIDRVATLLRDFYRSAPTEALDVSNYIDRFINAIEQDLAALLRPEFGLSRQRLETLAADLRRVLYRHAPRFTERVRAGCIVEAHGDLRPEHIYLGNPPAIIDCLEFNRRLRLLDPVDELGFLALECERLGAAEIGERLFAAGSDSIGDAPPVVIHFYRSYRAMLWAKLAILHIERHPPSEHGKWQQRCEEYLTLAERHIGLAR